MIFDAATKKRISRGCYSARRPTNMVLAGLQANRLVVNGINPSGKLKCVHQPPPWDRLSVNTRLVAMLHCINAMQNHTLFSITFNLHPKLSRRLYHKQSEKHLSDQFRKAVKSVLKSQDIYYALVHENKGPRRVHYHGFIAIPNRDPKKIAMKLTEALGNSCLCRKLNYKGANKAVLITSYWRNKSDKKSMRRPINFGWVMYINKNRSGSTHHFNSHALAREAKAYVARIREYTRKPVR